MKLIAFTRHLYHSPQLLHSRIFRRTIFVLENQRVAVQRHLHYARRFANEFAVHRQPDVIRVLPFPGGTGDLRILVDRFNPFAVFANFDRVIVVLNLPFADERRIAALRTGAEQKQQAAE